MNIICIDPGTANSAAVLRGGRPVIIPSTEGISVETKDALLKKEAGTATEQAAALNKLSQEAGAVIYAQSGKVSKGAPYAETRWEGGSPSDRGKVVDAEYKENRHP